MTGLQLGDVATHFGDVATHFGLTGLQLGDVATHFGLTGLKCALTSLQRALTCFQHGDVAANLGDIAAHRGLTGLQGDEAPVEGGAEGLDGGDHRLFVRLLDEQIGKYLGRARSLLAGEAGFLELLGDFQGVEGNDGHRSGPGERKARPHGAPNRHGMQVQAKGATPPLARPPPAAGRSAGHFPTDVPVLVE